MTEGYTVRGRDAFANSAPVNWAHGGINWVTGNANGDNVDALVSRRD